MGGLVFPFDSFMHTGTSRRQYATTTGCAATHRTGPGWTDNAWARVSVSVSVRADDVSACFNTCVKALIHSC